MNTRFWVLFVDLGDEVMRVKVFEYLEDALHAYVSTVRRWMQQAIQVNEDAGEAEVVKELQEAYLHFTNATKICDVTNVLDAYEYAREKVLRGDDPWPRDYVIISLRQTDRDGWAEL